MSSNQNSNVVASVLSSVIPLDSLVAPATSGSNDNALPAAIPAAPPSHPRPRDTSSLLASPEVVRAIRGTLVRHRVARQDLADGVAEVQLRTIAAARARRQPDDAGGWKALACTIAERMVREERRRRRKRGRYDTGLTDEADESAPLAPSPGKQRERLDLLAQLDVLRGQIDAGEMPEQGEAILLATAEGYSNAEIGRQLGIPPTVLKKRVFRMRRFFAAKLAALGMIDPDIGRKSTRARGTKRRRKQLTP